MLLLLILAILFQAVKSLLVKKTSIHFEGHYLAFVCITAPTIYLLILSIIVSRFMPSFNFKATFSSQFVLSGIALSLAVFVSSLAIKKSSIFLWVLFTKLDVSVIYVIELFLLNTTFSLAPTILIIISFLSTSFLCIQDFKKEQRFENLKFSFNLFFRSLIYLFLMGFAIIIFKRGLDEKCYTLFPRVLFSLTWVYLVASISIFLAIYMKSYFKDPSYSDFSKFKTTLVRSEKQVWLFIISIGLISVISSLITCIGYAKFSPFIIECLKQADILFLYLLLYLFLKEDQTIKKVRNPSFWIPASILLVNGIILGIFYL